MVKRQTVWLSTMMVLSLMLIGYYTINGNVKEVTSPSDHSPLDTSVIPTDSKAGPSDGSKATNQSSASKSPSTATADYFASLRSAHMKATSEMEDAERTIMVDSKSSEQAVSDAEQKLTQLQSVSAKEPALYELLKGAGFKDAAIVDDNGTNVTIAVQAASMTSDQAVKVMKMTADQLGVSVDHVVVKHYA